MADDSIRLTIDLVTSGDVRAPGLARWLQEVAPAKARGAMTVAIVPDARVRALNRRYRKKDKNTDVLSFPAEGPARAGHYVADVASGFSRTDAAPGFSRTRYLGDVVIAAGVARRQAREAGHSLRTELRVLALHGLLHLLGYDHEQDAGQMARLEQRLRRKGGLREGLIERSA
jgi:probable rRNA maturation factor